MNKDLDRIIDASINGALTFFVGAGVSAISNAPIWKDLLDEISKKLGRESKTNYSSDECLQIPQMYYYSIQENEKQYYDFLQRYISIKNLRPNWIHDEMLKLNPVSFITTNYDTLIEDAAIQHCISYKVASCDADISEIYGDRYILKMHGDFTHNNIVLKEEDYLNYSEKFKLMETMAKSVFSTNTIVFIGYGLNDYNIKLILNWTKTLLGRSFHKPIFVYCGKNALSNEELLYHESKGLSVIDCKRMCPKATDYSEQYRCFFNTLKARSFFSITDTTEEIAFNHLYDLLKPLDKMQSLRLADIADKLNPYGIISENGVIFIQEKSENIVKKFISINNMNPNKQNDETGKSLKQYRVILSVLKKARIRGISTAKGLETCIELDRSFADEMCLHNDYLAMVKYTNKNYRSLGRLYKKAFYLSRLGRYDESLFLFFEISQKAFKSKNYLTYYLAIVNCISLRNIVSRINSWHHCYDIEALESICPTENEVELLFTNLPAHFQKEYMSFKDILNLNMLYKYLYDSFLDGKNLQHSIDSDTIEIGNTSSVKVIHRINDYLHFLLGNGIIADEFLEYENTVKYLMSLLVYKYSTQGKKVIRSQLFDDIDSNDIFFDKTDFYCFVEYYSDKEIISLMKKYEIKTIEFYNPETIEAIVINVLEYYDYLMRNKCNRNEKLAIERKIQTVLALMRYVDISQELVEKLCRYLFEHDFYYILIDDKIEFIHSQLYTRHKKNKSITRFIEKTLITYIDKHIDALIHGESYDLMSSSKINYPYLAKYLSPDSNKYISEELSIRVNQIINNNLLTQTEYVSQFYWEYIKPYTKRKFVSWIKAQVRKEFRFPLFKTLIACNAKAESDIQNLLVNHLKGRIMIIKEEKINNEVVFIRKEEQYEELDLVGYWCFLNILNRDMFSQFQGISKTFDFYYLYGKCSGLTIDVSQLISIYPHVLKRLADNPKMKTKIRNAIVESLKAEQIASTDTKKLQKILIEYFC